MSDKNFWSFSLSVYYAFNGCFRTWSNIYSGAFLQKYFFLKAVFAKKHHHRCWIGLRVWNSDLSLVPNLQIILRKYSARKYVWCCFWKDKMLWWDSKPNEFLCRSSCLKGFIEKWCYEKYHRIHKKKSVAECRFW